MVKSVDVKGNRTVSGLTILAKVKTHADEPLSTVTLNEDLKRLYGLGYFTDVRIEQEEVAGGVNVMFVVTEKPVLSEIKIEGNKKIHKDQLKKEMQSVIGDFVDQKQVRDDVDAARKLYEKRGFSGAKIESVLDVDPSTNQAVLRVIVDEGDKIRIRDIKVEGNQSVKAGEILKVMKTKKYAWWGWFHSGFLKEEELAEDIERIRALYDEKGFSDVEVSAETQAIANTPDMLLKVIIKEGKKYLVGDVTLKGLFYIIISITISCSN